MDTNKYPDDMIGHIQAEVDRLIDGLDHAVPHDGPSKGNNAMIDVLIESGKLIKELSHLREVLDNDPLGW